jgi:hypothetical protein
MNLIVNNITNSSLDKLVLTSDAVTVSDLKKAIFDQLNIPVCRQALVFKEFYLNEGHKLTEYGLENGHIVTLKVKRSKLNFFFTRSIFAIFGAGFMWGLGHFVSVYFIRTFLLDLKNLKKGI